MTASIKTCHIFLETYSILWSILQPHPINNNNNINTNLSEKLSIDFRNQGTFLQTNFNTVLAILFDNYNGKTPRGQNLILLSITSFPA